MLTKKNLNFFFSTLATMYPDNRTELNRETPWQLLIAVVMSAQTTDKQVNRVTAKFFDTIKTPYDTLKLSIEQWSTYIAGVNYAPTKAKHLYQTAQILAQRGDSPPGKGDTVEPRGLIPSTISELITLPGIGEKTAKVIAHVLYSSNDVAVDTHVHRVSNRIGLVSTKLPLQTSRLLDTIIPINHKQSAHHTMVFFGRYHCTARKPNCDTCPFIQFCKYYKEVVTL